MPRFLLLAALLLLALLPREAAAQEESSLLEPPDLPQESIWLVGEEAPRRGCILRENGDSIEFLEIVQKAGRRVALVSWPIPLDEVQSEHTVRLSPAERERLLEWIEQVRQRATIEAGRLEAIELHEQEIEGATLLVYEGPWFTLASNADDEMTRRCVVRIEQIFRAYRLILPPRRQPAKPLQIRLYGSLEAYNHYLEREGIVLSNPAFYSLRENLIVAGGELSPFADYLAEVRQHNDNLRQQLNDRESALPARLAEISSRLNELGHSQEEITQSLARRRRAEEADIASLRQQLLAAERQNNARFDELCEQMFRRLYHEALHAYIENYVFPHEAGEVPPWLNEGLALIFEGGQLDAERLRIDRPHRQALDLLKRDLESPAPLPLRDVILADSEDFHFHSLDDPQASRYYAYAWGLTWYLSMAADPAATGSDPLTLSQVENCLTPAGRETTDEQRIIRFELLVGMPLERFETRWREAMREM